MAGFILGRRARARRPRVLARSRRRCSRSPSSSASRRRPDADLVQLYGARRPVTRRGTPFCFAAASRWRRVLDLPWEADDPAHSAARRGRRRGG